MRDDSQTQTLTGAGLLDALAGGQGAMSPKLRAIAQFALSQPQDFARMTSREICAELHVSEPTLIRFCRNLGYAGLADFRIELALTMAQRGVSLIVNSADRRASNPEGKARIARAAIGLVRGDRSILLDNGTTVEAFATRMGDLDPLVVMTNGLPAAQRIMEIGRHKVMLTGGDIQPETASLTGRLVENSLHDMRFDTFIMAADSIDPRCGICTFSESEAHITRAMIGAAARVIALVDHRKFSQCGLHRICGLGRISALVVDQPLPEPLASAAKDHNVTVIVAKET